jgi:hypothetical protein
VKQQESWKLLPAHISSQNHYRDHDAGDDQAKGYGGRDNFKFVPVLCEMQAWEQQSSKIIFQHKKPLIGIKPISAPIPFNVHILREICSEMRWALFRNENQFHPHNPRVSGLRCRPITWRLPPMARRAEPRSQIFGD